MIKYNISEQEIEKMFEKEFEETEFLADRARREAYDRFARGVDCCLDHINKHKNPALD